MVLETLLTGMAAGAAAAGVLASRRDGVAPRDVASLQLPKPVWAGTAWLLLGLSLLVAVRGYGAATGVVTWLAAISIVGAAAVGVVGAWPRSAVWIAAAGCLLGLTAPLAISAAS